MISSLTQSDEDVKIRLMFQMAKINFLHYFRPENANPDYYIKYLNDKKLSTILANEMLRETITDNWKSEAILKWADENVSSDVFDDPTISKSIMKSVLEKVTFKTKLEADATNEKEILKRYSEVLKYFVKDNNNMMVDALFELQDFCFSNDAPKGFGERWFGYLLDFGIISRKAIYNWEDDKDDRTPGKTELTNQVSKYIQNLKSKKYSNSDESLQSIY